MQSTLPVFFQSSNSSGPWSPAAAKAIAKFAMATNEKAHAMLLPDGTRQSEELAGPAACRQIAKEGTGTATFFYLNSVIDWPFNYKLHDNMVKTPAWRENNASGGGIITHSNFMYGRPGGGRDEGGVDCDLRGRGEVRTAAAAASSTRQTSTRKARFGAGVLPQPWRRNTARVIWRR